MIKVEYPSFIILDRIFELPPGKKILYVNDFIETAKEAVSNLKRLGIDHVDYIPYSPTGDYPRQIDIAISPGETASIPPSVPNKIDIGVRLIDLNTIMKIIYHFQLSEQLTFDITDRYTRKIIELGPTLSRHTIQSYTPTYDIGHQVGNLDHCCHVAVNEKRLGNDQT